MTPERLAEGKKLLAIAKAPGASARDWEILDDWLCTHSRDLLATYQAPSPTGEQGDLCPTCGE